MYFPSSFFSLISFLYLAVFIVYIKMPRGQPPFLVTNPGKKSVCQTRASQKALAAKEFVAGATEPAPVP
jgi:hypothetical protein